MKSYNVLEVLLNKRWIMFLESEILYILLMRIQFVNWSDPKNDIEGILFIRYGNHHSEFQMLRIYLKFSRHLTDTID